MQTNKNNAHHEQRPRIVDCPANNWQSFVLASSTPFGKHLPVIAPSRFAADIFVFIVISLVVHSM